MENEVNFEIVHFSVEGKYISDLARNFFLEGEYNRAIRLLTNDNIEDPTRIGLSIKILKGDGELSGFDDEIVFEDKEDLEYKKQVQEHFNSLYCVNNKWIKPIAKIITIKEGDALCYDRASLYKRTGETILFIKGIPYICEKSAPPPFFFEEELREKVLEEKDVTELGFDDYDYFDFYENFSIANKRTERDFFDFLTENYDDLPEDNYRELQNAIDLEIDARFAYSRNIMIQSIKDLVLEKTKDFIEIEEFKIPRAPFLKWLRFHDPRLFERSSFQSLLLEGAAEWEDISPYGLKCGGDDSSHTDWVIGAGIDPKDYYQSRLESVVFNYLHSFFGTDSLGFMNVTAKGLISGKIADIETAGKEDIVIIPHAGVEYFEIAKKVKAVITELGGPTAHLVVNAGESNISLILMPYASTKLKVGDQITIDANVNCILLKETK